MGPHGQLSVQRAQALGEIIEIRFWYRRFLCMSRYAHVIEIFVILTIFVSDIIPLKLFWRLSYVPTCQKCCHSWVLWHEKYRVCRSSFKYCCLCPELIQAVPEGWKLTWWEDGLNYFFFRRCSFRDKIAMGLCTTCCQPTWCWISPPSSTGRCRASWRWRWF